MTLYLCVVKWLVLYWEHEEGVPNMLFQASAEWLSESYHARYRHRVQGLPIVVYESTIPDCAAAYHRF